MQSFLRKAEISSQTNRFNGIEGLNLLHEITMWTFDCVDSLVLEKVQSKKFYYDLSWIYLAC